MLNESLAIVAAAALAYATFCMGYYLGKRAGKAEGRKPGGPG